MKYKLININEIGIEVKCEVEYKGETLRFNVSCTSLSPLRITSTHDTMELGRILDFINQHISYPDLATSITSKLNSVAADLTHGYEMIEEAKRGNKTIGWKTAARKRPARKRVR
jgi:hypothetical protein